MLGMYGFFILCIIDGVIVFRFCYILYLFFICYFLFVF
jgi:hypothetical protein